MIVLTAIAAAMMASTCSLPSGWETVAVRHTRYVIFGEAHGTRQSPTLFGNVACALAARGEHILIAIEQNTDDDPALQAAWSLPDDRFAIEVKRAGWAGRDDGVASRAMYALLLRLHRLKQAGRAIAIVAFNGSSEQEGRAPYASLPGQGPHEAAQAANILAAAARAQYDRVLILVGNLHARKQPVARGGVTFEPMAMRLAPAADITSLNMRDAGGTMWNCLLRPGFALTVGKPLPDGAMDCADHHAAGRAIDLPVPSVGRGDADGSASDPAYDGFYWVGKVTGSAPLVPAAPVARPK